MHIRKFNESKKDDKNLIEEVRQICTNFTDNGFKFVYEKSNTLIDLHCFNLIPTNTKFYSVDYGTNLIGKNLDSMLSYTSLKERNLHTFNINIEELYDRIMGLESDDIAINEFKAVLDSCRIFFSINTPRWKHNKNKDKPLRIGSLER